MILIQVNLKIMCSTLKYHLFGVASQITCIAFRTTTTPRLPYKGCSFKAQTHSQLGIKAKTKDNCNPLRATLQWSHEVAWAIAVNKPFLKNGPNGPVIVYCIFTFHSIQTPGPLFCCKMTSPQQCTVCTRFLHMARKGLYIELVMHS